MNEIILKSFEHILKPKDIKLELNRLKIKLSKLQKIKGNTYKNVFNINENKQDKIKEIDKSISMLNDLRNDLKINNINIGYLETFYIEHINDNDIILMITKKLNKNHIFIIDGKKYNISGYINIISKSDLGENLNNKGINIVIINGKVYEINLKNFKLQLSKKIKINNLGLIINGKNTNKTKQQKNTKLLKRNNNISKETSKTNTGLIKENNYVLKKLGAKDFNDALKIIKKEGKDKYYALGLQLSVNKMNNILKKIQEASEQGLLNEKNEDTIFRGMIANPRNRLKEYKILSKIKDGKYKAIILREINKLTQIKLTYIYNNKKELKGYINFLKENPEFFSDETKRLIVKNYNDNLVSKSYLRYNES